MRERDIERTGKQKRSRIEIKVRKQRGIEREGMN